MNAKNLKFSAKKRVQMDNLTYGKKGEILAQNYLKKLGYKIIATNMKNNIGEIDIIAKHKKTIVFVEVKTRISNAFGYPAEAVDERKQQKIRAVAELYLQQNKLTNAPCRFDVVSVLGDEDYKIDHIINAF